MAINGNNIPQEPRDPAKRQAPIEPGTYPARLVQIIELGLQPQQPFKGEEKKPAYEVMFTYEFVDEFCKDLDEASDTFGEFLEDKPRWLSETMPLHPLRVERAKCTARYNAFDPDHADNGDWDAQIGKAVNVTIINNKATKGKHAGRTFDKIDSVKAMRARDIAKTPELQNEPKVLSLDSGDVELYKALPQWIQDKIAASLNWEDTDLCAALNGAPAKVEQDVPNVEPVVEIEDGEDNWD